MLLLLLFFHFAYDPSSYHMILPYTYTEIYATYTDYYNIKDKGAVLNTGLQIQQESDRRIDSRYNCRSIQV